MKPKVRTGLVHEVRAFLWWCAGADPKILKGLPTEGVKYSGIGVAILSTGLLACLSGGYALNSALGNLWLAYALGVLWGLFIFNVDRLVMSTMRQGASAPNTKVNFLRALVTAIPRLLLVIFFGIVISVPIQLKLFQREINQEIQTERAAPLEEIDNNIAKKNAELDELRKALQSETERVDEKLNSYVVEMNGTGGTRRPGHGPVLHLKLMDYEEAKNQLTHTREILQPQIIKTSSELAALMNQRQALSASNSERIFDEASKIPVLAQVSALSVLSQKDSRIAWARTFITLLLILLATSPILVKLLSEPDRYEQLLEATERIKPEASLHPERINAELQKAFVEALDKSALKHWK
ncbi:MAG: hypothetical protein QOH41_4147 [Blastocatellia bacterium]|jgi:hypothetical protein|nr:hypothetical protein [Blastocatellia bacterium]